DRAVRSDRQGVAVAGRGRAGAHRRTGAVLVVVSGHGGLHRGVDWRSSPRRCGGIVTRGRRAIARGARRPAPGRPASWGGDGAPGGIRTPDQWLRKPLLYPAELQARRVQDLRAAPPRAVPSVRPGRRGRRAAGYCTAIAGEGARRGWRADARPPGQPSRRSAGRIATLATMLQHRTANIPPGRAAPGWRRRLALYWALLRGDRPIGWLLLLWPTWWALWIAAEGVPPAWILFVFSAGVWLTRSAGCVINDYADRWLDGSVERTRGRPLATGAVSGREALAVFAVLMLAAFALVLTLNRLTVLLSVAGLFLAATYPYLKRYTYLPQVYLGMAFGWGIPMAFAAVQGSVPPLAWVLYVANIFWATAYDTWYAMVDRDDDIRMGAKSTAILFGDLDLVAQAVLYAATFLALVLAGRQAGLGGCYWAGLGMAALLVAWEFAIARHRE